MIVYVVLDVGCLECGLSTDVLYVGDDRQAALDVANKAAPWRMSDIDPGWIDSTCFLCSHGNEHDIQVHRFERKADA